VGTPSRARSPVAIESPAPPAASESKQHNRLRQTRNRTRTDSLSSAVKTFLRPPRVFIVLAVLTLGFGALAITQFTGKPQVDKLDLGTFESKVADGEVAEAELFDRDNVVSGKLSSGRKFKVSYPAEYGDELTAKLLDSKVKVKPNAQRSSIWVNLLYTFFPLLLIMGVLVWFVSKAPGGRGMMQLGRSKAKRWKADGPVVTFADVAGMDEAVDELVEIREFLQSPARFEAVGARIPRGVLLSGPPGTGKTLLARAVAGEAGVPFFSISGSDFVEMFVGVGASRVRDLFQQAKAEAPSIIFVDEIDGVGRHRGQGLSGANDEREQTLNQLLVEMDGFDQNSGVIVIVGTNRPDILDQALLRPGRFDRQITIDKPDVRGRRAILQVHAKGKPLAPEIDLDVVAKRTPGFTGADLANVLNEAAIFTARRGEAIISMTDVESAVDRVMTGPEKRARVLSEDERRITAFHEAGHAVVGHVSGHGDPIHKISIVARGMALGVTISLPEEERLTYSRRYLCDQLAMLFGGWAAEELAMGDTTTGAANDIERATVIARKMVTQFGMSDVVGLRRVGSDDQEPFAQRDHSEALAAEVDSEVRHLLDEARDRARSLLVEHRPLLDRLASELLEHETLDEHQLAAIFDTA
jgi:cell division protease FtsH